MLRNCFLTNILEAGTDEAGRGCLAGPVTAAAIILPENFDCEFLNDSKKISATKREFLKPILENSAITFSVIHIDSKIIDDLNILNASLKAMQSCILNLKPTPKHIIVDGNQPLIQKKGIIYTSGKIFTAVEMEKLMAIPSTSIIKGDSQYKSIAAASVLAKTYRDEYMNTIHLEFPMYNWKQNKGYPTKEHREAIKKYGITKYHRLSFKLLDF